MSSLLEYITMNFWGCYRQIEHCIHCL